MTRVCLVRHGQTDWNLQGRYQGQSDVPLNAAGEAQAQRLAQQLKDEEFAAVYSSDLMRAKSTANVLASVLSLPLQVDSRLREINQGEWEGLLVTVIQDSYAELWRQRRINPASVRPPGGETVEEVARRVYAAMHDIARAYPAEAVVVVSHGLSLATIICKVENIPVGRAYEVIPENAEPVWVNWNGST